MENRLWNGRLSDPNRQNLNSWCPDQEVLREGLDNMLIKLIEKIDIDLLQCMLTAKLVDLVMDFVGDPIPFVVFSVV